MIPFSSGDDATFGNFVATAASGQALRLARALASRRPAGPRLLLMYGPPGTGKTHLLRAIIHAAEERDPPVPSLRTSAMECVSELISGPHLNAPRELRHPWPFDGIVTIDDLHPLSGKPATLGEAGRQLVAAFDHGCCLACAVGHLDEIPELAGILRRRRGIRFVGLRRPNGREMRRILGATPGGRSLSPAALNAMASTCHGDVRRAVGAMAHRRLEASIAGFA